MKFSIKHQVTKENIIKIEYEKGQNKWLIAIQKALEIKADLSWANLSKADLSGANLSGANLSWANLSGANLDFSSGFTFACKTFNIKSELRLAAQLAYHFCRFNFSDCEEAEQAQAALKELANKFHRVSECGRIA